MAYVRLVRSRSYTPTPEVATLIHTYAWRLGVPAHGQERSTVMRIMKSRLGGTHKMDDMWWWEWKEDPLLRSFLHMLEEFDAYEITWKDA